MHKKTTHNNSKSSLITNDDTKVEVTDENLRIPQYEFYCYLLQVTFTFLSQKTFGKFYFYNITEEGQRLSIKIPSESRVLKNCAVQKFRPRRNLYIL